MTIWQQYDFFPQLKESQVHIWRANLALLIPKIEQLTTYLSADEIARASKFRFDVHKNRFIAARGILRQLLGNYLQLSPSSIVFNYSDRGKPQLAQDTALQFNISHSQDYALFGFTLNHLIGVDLEYQKSMPDAIKIAQRFFSPREFQMLQATTRENQSKLFFQLWTFKEAYLKAIGTGISGSLANAEIAFDQTKAPYLWQLPADSATPWSLYSCDPDPNYLGAIAINSHSDQQTITYWHWQ